MSKRARPELVCHVPHSGHDTAAAMDVELLAHGIMCRTNA